MVRWRMCPKESYNLCAFSECNHRKPHIEDEHCVNENSQGDICVPCVLTKPPKIDNWFTVGDLEFLKSIKVSLGDKEV